MERMEQAVILAAGEGQRLRPFTALKPKVMIPIANKPILQYVVEALAQNGIRRLVMVVGYRKEQVQDYFGSGEHFGVEIQYINQPQQLGTAHALKQVKDVTEDKFLVLSGDNIIDPDTIAQFVEANPISMLIKEQRDASKYGVVTLKDGTVWEIVEKPKEVRSNLVNTGIYAFTRQIFEFVEEEVDLTSALQIMIAQSYLILAQETYGTWLDVVYPWDILNLNSRALSGISANIGGTVEGGVTLKDPIIIGEGTTIRSNSYIVGPVIIGENCEIGPNVCIFPSTSIGDNTIILPFSQLKNSVIGGNAFIGPSCSIQDSIIERNSVLDGYFIARSSQTRVEVNGEYHRVKIGAMVGEYCHIEDNVIIQPGIIIGNYCQIGALKVVGQNLSDRSLVV